MCFNSNTKEKYLGIKIRQIVKKSIIVPFHSFNFVILFITGFVDQLSSIEFSG